MVSSSQDLLAVNPPSPLQQFRRYGLRVTDLSDQLWCEQRLALSLARGKEETPEMKQGKERHQALHEEITEVIRVRPDTRADLWLLHFFNAWAALVQLQQQGICREIPVFGPISGVWVVGVIDQVQTSDAQLLVLSDTKTRKKPSLPTLAQKRTTQLQMMLYHRLWSQLTQQPDPYAVFAAIDLPVDVEASPAFVAQLSEHALPSPTPFAMLAHTLDAFASALPLDPQMAITYEWQQDHSVIGVDTFSFSHDWLERQIQHGLPFWHGERQPTGVSEQDAWKCRFCDFAPECPVRPRSTSFASSR
jgi:exonuclease V